MNDGSTGRIGPAVALLASVLVFVVVLVGVIAPGWTVAAGDGTLADQQSIQTPTHSLEFDGYAVEQGDRCLPVEPLGDGSRSVGAYYDYRNPNSTPAAYTYSSYGTTSLQEDDTSVLFLHEGTEGLALAVVHDRLDGDTDGGSATMQFDDLPADGVWAVEDDAYEGRDDVFTHQNTSSRLSWVWSTGRTDGAAFAGLGDDFAITITPAFNERADVRYMESGYDGRVTDWQLLAGDGEDPERTSLDMTEPIQIRSGGCTAVTALAVDGTASAGDEVTIDATVLNDGERPETVTVPFVVDGEVVAEQTVTLDGGAARTLSTTVALDATGARTVSVGEVGATVEVTTDSRGDSMPGFGSVASLLAMSVVLLVGRYR